jgi:hypothetical protein
MRLLVGGALLLLTGQTALASSDFKLPTIVPIQVDWRAAIDRLRTELNSQPGVAGAFSFTGRRRLRPYDPRMHPALVQLNAVTSPVFAGIGQSPIPVLLPFDTAGFLSHRLNGGPDTLPAAHYQSGFRTASLFDAGPAGYSAMFTIGAADGLPSRRYVRPVEVHITGSNLTYDIGDPLAGRGEPVKALAREFPDLRRVIREGFVRYAFTRFGVPYVVSIHCLDSVPRARRLACREASAVAERFLAALRVTGGQPKRRRAMPDLLAERPAETSPDFTYRPPGDILANSGYRGQNGHPDYTVYSQIRFPLQDAPAYANSQSFLNWGDCFMRGRIPRPSGKGSSYRCRSSDKQLVFDESAGENYAYPWQDNFCEARDFGVGQCASGLGHQGQDIRPSSCTLRNQGADRCVPNRFPIVAVRDGVILRTPGAQAATLLVNARTEHVRFRYMHMNPVLMDADGVVSGREVSEGETIGLVSNYQDYPGGTTTHLHFDIQVFTPDGWLWVNPYITLVSSYERLLGARGRELAPEPAPPTPAMATALPDDPARAGASAEGVEN